MSFSIMFRKEGVVIMSKKSLEEMPIKAWDEAVSPTLQKRAVQALEEGKVLYFPSLAFKLSPEEHLFLSPEMVDSKRKNISYDLRLDNLGGSLWEGKESELLKEMMKRYAVASRDFLTSLIPSYTSHLIQAKTSFRPVEIFGRKSSIRKDDTRLHVDGFPSNPTQGQRILRVFCNINPDGKPRTWRIGESFEEVVKKFIDKISPPIPGFSSLLKLFKITKSLRTPYDHYMLHMHNKMKENDHYQKSVSQEEILFPAGSAWIVYTDQVSHAAMAGQHVLEQTFHLPVKGLFSEETAPLRVLEKHLKRSLI